jgi:DNA primase
LRLEPADDEPPTPTREAHSRVREKQSPKQQSKPVEPHDSKGENKPLEFVLKNLQSDHPYFAERKLTAETVAAFGLGFCQKGLLAGRIAIPIHNATGELVAYGGRWPGQTDKEKYLFPKGFKKSLELFNLHRAIAQTADKPLVIVEGFFDCMTLWQHGYKCVVALMGSSMSSAQEDILRRHTNRNSQVIVMLDEDDAGREGRENVANRLSKFCFVKVHEFEKPGMQPDQLSSDQFKHFFGGVE